MLASLHYVFETYTICSWCKFAAFEMKLECFSNLAGTAITNARHLLRSILRAFKALSATIFFGRFWDMIFNRTHGPQKFLKDHGVSLRFAEIEDADQLIALNKAFRAEMMQWEVGMGLASTAYPVLDLDDIEYIVNEEKDSFLIVLGRKEGSHERLIGYSYAYLEDWGLEPKAKPRKRNQGKNQRHSNNVINSRKVDGSESHRSLYIAELFVIESERGLGFGELLLCEILRRSHKPSGDLAHDLVMELGDCQKSAAESATRLDKRVEDDLFGERRRSTRASPPYPAMPDGPSSPTPYHSSRRHTPEPCGGVAQHYPAHAPHKSSPSMMPKAEDLGFAATKNGAVPFKRGGRTTQKPGAHSVDDSQRETELERKRAAHALESDSHKLIVGDLFEITTRHHRGYERKFVDLSIPGPDSARVGTSSHSSCDDLPLAESHKNRKRVREDSSVLSNGLRVDSIGSIQCSKRKKADEISEIFDENVMARKKTAKCRNVPKIEAAASAAGFRSEKSSSRPSRHCRFLLTGFSRAALQRRLEEGIRKLGGQVCDSEGFDPTCTHVVCPFPLETEKFMCGLAAGKTLVHSTYIEQSIQSGYLLPEVGFEWVSIAASCDGAVSGQLSTSSLELANCVLLWKDSRHHKEKLHSSDSRSRKFSSAVQDHHMPTDCYAGMVAMLLVSPPDNRSLQRLIEAGGAVRCADFLNSDRNKAQEFTHVFVSMDLFGSGSEVAGNWGGEDIHRRALKFYRELHHEGALCVRAEYLVDLLIKGPSLDIEPYLLQRDGSSLYGLSRPKLDKFQRNFRKSLFDAEPIRSKRSPNL